MSIKYKWFRNNSQIDHLLKPNTQELEEAPQNELREEIRTADLWKLMFKLTPVAILSMSINSINTFVDALFIGQYIGEIALAAVSLAFPLAFITNSVAAMIGVGGSSLLSRAIGANDLEIQAKTFGTITVLSIVCSAFLTIVSWYFAEWMIASLGGTGEVLRLGTLYYRTLILGAIFQIFSVGVNLLIRAEGKIKEAMTFAIISTVLNMILTPIFLGYLDWGIAGAAWASILSAVVFSIMNIWYYWADQTSYRVDRSYFRLELKLVRPILAVGVSAMMLQLMFVLQQIVVFKSLAVHGTDRDIAFMGACYRILILLLVPGFGFSTALQPVAGINFGANDYGRVKKAFWVFTSGSAILLFILWSSAMLFPQVVLGWMLPDYNFTDLDLLNFRLMMAPCMLFPFFFMGFILFQSIGNYKTAGMLMVSREVLFFIPIVLLLPIWYGVTGIYATTIPQNVITFLVVGFVLWQLFNKWSAIQLVHKPVKKTSV